MPVMRHIFLPSTSNQPLAVTLFEAANPSRVVVIASATGVKQAYYARFASFLGEQGMVAITFDYSGIGHSRTASLRKFDTSALAWGSHDLESVVCYAREQFPGIKCCLIGHSIGGQIIGLSRSAVAADKILLVAAQTGYWKFWKGWNRLRMWANWHLLFPFLLAVFGYLPSKKISGMEDLPKGVALQWRKWCMSPGYLFDHLPEETLFYKNYQGPLSSFSVEDDAFAPRPAVDWMTGRYQNSRLNRIHLIPAALHQKNIGHFGFFQSRFKDVIWTRMLDEIVSDC